MTIGLPVSRLVAVAVSLQALAASAPNVNSLLLLGGTDVIDTAERLRSYGDMTGVGADFSTTDPEYLAAAIWFGQSPKPTQLYIGRYAQNATKGRLNGGALTAAQQALANFTGVTTGSFKIAVDGGSLTAIAGLNFTAATSLAGVASIINAALTGATCVWDSVRGRFVLKSTTTGASSAISYLASPSSGTDISALLAGTLVTGASTVTGIVQETPLAGVTALAAASNDWYAVHMAALASPAVTDANLVAVSGFVEAASPPRFHLYTSQDSTAMNAGNTGDVFSLMKAAGYAHSWGQYSSASPYAAVSAAARILTTNFNANRSVITLMYKQEPGIAAETLTTSQADVLQSKYANVFINYNNSTAIIQYGQVASGAYFDEIYGADWLAGQIQANLYNLLYTSTTKIPQTDSGNQILASGIEAACFAAVNNGLLAPGIWTLGGFGQLKQGAQLPKGYYIYTPPVALQSDADRALRKSVAFQVAGKLAGAVHTAGIVVNINR